MELAMQKTVLVPVADGTEELEAVAIIDVLRRAGGDGNRGVGDRSSADHGIPWRGHRGRRPDRGVCAKGVRPGGAARWYPRSRTPSRLCGVDRHLF